MNGLGSPGSEGASRPSHATAGVRDARPGRRVVPVILSGGSGSRLWPLSRESYPKQFLSLASHETLLQQAALRVSDPARFKPLIVVANADHRFIVAEQLRSIAVEPAVLALEPAARNTAAAVAAAAILALRDDPEALVLISPSDQALTSDEGFRQGIEDAVEAAMGGALVLFGVVPDHPATGYGYLQLGAPLAGSMHAVAKFVEKPDAVKAQALFAAGGVLWNSGNVLGRAATFISELERFEPDIVACVRAAVEGATIDMGFLRLDPVALNHCPAISIDHAVMERTAKAAVAPAAFGWRDVGSWSAVSDLGSPDADGNVVVGDGLLENVRNAYVRSEGPLVAVVGLDDVIVVATADAVLVTSRHADQQVKQVVDRLKASNHAAAARSPRVHRPWGWYEGVQRGERYQVKCITVHPGKRLSLQRHVHRAEHWVVVNGTAEVQIDGQARLVTENESVYIPLGSAHRLSNPGKVPLNLIEIQSGAYLGEDDIVRLTDDYARA